MFVVCGTSCVLLPLFSLRHWRHVYDFHDASVSASLTHTLTHPHTRSSMENACPFNCLLSPRLRPLWAICLMKLFACIINSFWYFTFNLTIINWMLSLSHEIRPNLFLFPFLFLLRRFAFLFLGPNCIRLRLRLSPRPTTPGSDYAPSLSVAPGRLVRASVYWCVLTLNEAVISHLAKLRHMPHATHGTEQKYLLPSIRHVASVYPVWASVKRVYQQQLMQ